MKVRIITGAVGGVVAIAALLFVPVWGIRSLVAAICVLAMTELLSACKCKHIGLYAAAILYAAACPFFELIPNQMGLWMGLVAYVTVLAFIQIASHETLPFEMVGFTLATSVMVILPLSTLASIRAIPDHGKALLFFPFIVAWFSDMGAYFVGSFFGKHKLCVKISPKKTVEGLIGGIITAVLFSLLGAFIYQVTVLQHSDAQVTYWLVAFVALVTAPISVIGDLFCSVIKRHRGIKDFGNVFPGHGGILDRFDSLVFVSPILYVLCQVLPLIR